MPGSESDMTPTLELMRELTGSPKDDGDDRRRDALHRALTENTPRVMPATRRLAEGIEVSVIPVDPGSVPDGWVLMPIPSRDELMNRARAGTTYEMRLWSGSLDDIDHAWKWGTQISDKSDLSAALRLRFASIAEIVARPIA